MRHIEFVNQKKEEKKISEIKSGDMFKLIFDVTDERRGEKIFAGTYFTKVESNIEIDWNAVSNNGNLHCFDEDLYVECVNSTLLIEN